VKFHGRPADDGRQRGCTPCPADRVVKGVAAQVEPDPAEMAARQRLRLERATSLLIMRQQLVNGPQGITSARESQASFGGVKRAIGTTVILPASGEAEARRSPISSRINAQCFPNLQA
jgi:hypothetical protein